MSERTATIRCHRTATLGSDSEGAADLLHAGRDQTTLFWVSQGNPPFSPLAGVEEAEDCRTQGDVGAYPDYVCACGTAGELPLHGIGGMWQKDFREAMQKVSAVSMLESRAAWRLR
jgi:hypothetical protein